MVQKWPTLIFKFKNFHGILRFLAAIFEQFLLKIITNFHMGPRHFFRQISRLKSNFSPSFKCKIFQKFKISQPKVINCSLLGDFCLTYFKILIDFKIFLKCIGKFQKNQIQKNPSFIESIQNFKISNFRGILRL